MLSGLNTTDDPGLDARLLRASNAIRRSRSRRRRCPAMRPLWLAVAEAATVALVTLVVFGWVVATP